MKLNQTAINRLPTRNIKQIEHKREMQKRLNEAEALARDYPDRLNRIKALDQRQDDLSPDIDVIVTQDKGYKSTGTVEATQRNGNWVVKKRLVEETRYGENSTEKLRAWGPKENRHYLFTHNKLQDQNQEYSYTKLRVDSTGDEITYHFRQGKGTFARLVTGFDLAGRALGGSIGAIFSKLNLPSVSVEFGKKQSD